ncbi:hypothetical protein SCHPADRAFT_905218 [Schizopora paradoxa]|uniref:Hydrophobin n=1 Tax=Schizopora paradoxa TaxID=27342 RepID=A0A0H2S5X6_9AGAM|nr:hypothetical protein SCHPADRAFT_905218 [Schizopora paradoxa]
MRNVALLTVALTALFVRWTAGQAGQDPDECAANDLFCCEQFFNGSLPGIISLPPAFTIPPTFPLGVNCTSISIVDVIERSCTTQTLCCTGSIIGNGLLVEGCEPMNSLI